MGQEGNRLTKIKIKAFPEDNNLGSKVGKLFKKELWEEIRPILGRASAKDKIIRKALDRREREEGDPGWNRS